MEVVHGATAVWFCSECGHGSPDPRDERAHRDAHGQLRAFLAEWEAGTEPGAVTPALLARRRSVLYAGCALVVLLVWAVTVFSNLNRGSDAFRPVPPPASTPVGGEPPAARRQPAPPPPASAGPVSPPMPVPAVPLGNGPLVDAPVPAPAVTVAPAPVATTAEPTGLATAAPAPRHLLTLCLLGICLTVL